MATQYGIAAADGTINTLDVAWATARDAGSGIAVNNYASSPQAVGIDFTSGRTPTYTIYRSFFAFDTSGISSTVSSATLKIRGRSNGAADFFVVKSEHQNPLVGTDYDAITGWSSGDNSGNVTKYSSEVTSWNTSTYNTITLNASALSDLVSLSTFKVCLIEADHDLVDSAPTSDFFTGMWYTEAWSTSRDPYIDYTLGAVGYGNDVIGVASGDISKINGIATADISKVNGV
jgi:hypothetical protein